MEGALADSKDGSCSTKLLSLVVSFIQALITVLSSLFIKLLNTQKLHRLLLGLSRFHLC